MPALQIFRRLLQTPTSPELGPGPRAGVEPLRALQSRLDEALAGQKVSQPVADSLRAVVLLWHDHHEPAHALVQDGATADASYVHGILHRREPDYGNARYWFQRVREHPAFEKLAAEVGKLLSGHPALRSQLLPNGTWDSFAFIDACEEAQGGGDEGEMLRRVQEVEFRVLLEYLCGEG